VRWLRKALIAPCVVTLAACGAASSSRGVVVSSAGLRLAGIHWVLTQVSHNGKPPVVIPASTEADVQFRRDGTAVANDGVNGLDADYTATTTIIALHNAMFGAVGYGGGDPVLDATTRSLGDLFDRGDASYTITGRVLTIDTPSWTLTFANAGPLRGPTGPPAPTQS
jgi:heat shock protein HslJ